MYLVHSFHFTETPESLRRALSKGNEDAKKVYQAVQNWKPVSDPETEDPPIAGTQTNPPPAGNLPLPETEKPSPADTQLADKFSTGI